MPEVLSCKCRINPNWDLKIAFWDAFGASRFVSNNVRQKVRQARIHNKIIDKNCPESKDEKIRINRSFYNDCLRELKHENPFLYEIDSTALQESTERLQRAYKRYDKRLSGEPKIKTLKNPVQSFTIKNINNSIRLKDNYIRLNKYGFIKLRGLRPILGRIQTVTILYDKGRWFAILTYRIEIRIDPLPLTGKAVGIDVGLKNYITLSTGEVIAKPDTRDLDDKIKKQRKIVSRRFQSSPYGSNYLKAVEKLQRLEHKRNDIINDFHHKISKKIVTEYDIIVMETLNIKGMLKNHHVSSGIHDAAWYKLKQKIKYKAELYGKTFIEIDQWFASTKTCHKCGHKNNNITLKDREWNCPKCGTHHERDHNAAINILNEGLKTLKKNKPRGPGG